MYLYYKYYYIELNILMHLNLQYSVTSTKIGTNLLNFKFDIFLVFLPPFMKVDTLKIFI